MPDIPNETPSTASSSSPCRSRTAAVAARPMPCRSRRSPAQSAAGGSARVRDRAPRGSGSWPPVPLLQSQLTTFRRQKWSARTATRDLRLPPGSWATTRVCRPAPTSPRTSDSVERARADPDGPSWVGVHEQPVALDRTGQVHVEVDVDERPRAPVELGRDPAGRVGDQHRTGQAGQRVAVEQRQRRPDPRRRRAGLGEPPCTKRQSRLAP